VQFRVTTHDVRDDTDVTITATLGSVKRTAKLTVKAVLDNLFVCPDQVHGSDSALGKVTTKCAAPSGGINITLLSSDAVTASVPGSVTVPVTEKAANFAITTTEVQAETEVSIVAHAAGSTQTGTLTVTNGLSLPGNYTCILNVIPGGFHYNSTLQIYIQDVVVGNPPNSNTIIRGPLWLVLDKQSQNPEPWTLANAISLTAIVPPINRPYVAVLLVNNTFLPGQSSLVRLQFRDPTNAPILWKPRTLAVPRP